MTMTKPPRDAPQPCVCQVAGHKLILLNLEWHGHIICGRGFRHNGRYPPFKSLLFMAQMPRNFLGLGSDDLLYLIYLAPNVQALNSHRVSEPILIVKTTKTGCLFLPEEGAKRDNFLSLLLFKFLKTAFLWKCILKHFPFNILQVATLQPFLIAHAKKMNGKGFLKLLSIFHAYFHCIQAINVRWICRSIWATVIYSSIVGTF